jgi:hypothetical protein
VGIAVAHHQFTAPGNRFHQKTVRAMGPVKGEIGAHEGRGQAIAHRVARPCAESRRHLRQRGVIIGQAARLIQIPLRVERQRRIAVHAIILQSQEIGPNITFLDHMDAQVAQSGHAMRRGMVGAAITIEDKIRHAMVDDKIVKEERPVAKCPAIIGRLAWPVHLVAAIDIDPQRSLPTRTKRVGQHREIGTMRPLQEQKCFGRRFSHEGTQRTMS